MQPLRLHKSELFQYRVTLLPASHWRRHHSVLSYQGCRHDQHGRAKPSWWDRGGLDPYSKTWGDSSYIVSLGTTAASRNRKSEQWDDCPSLWTPVPSHHCGSEKEVRPQFFSLWGRFKVKESADHCWWHSSCSCCWSLPLRRQLFVHFWRRNTETGILQFSQHQDYFCWSRDSLWWHRDWDSWFSLPLVKLEGMETVWCTVF